MTKETNRIESREKALRAAKAAIEKHADGVEVLDLRTLSTVADFFVVGTAASRRQLQAIVDEIQEEFEQRSQRIGHLEGLLPAALAKPLEAFAWVLMDCGDVIIHLFTPPARTFYQLERLWADAPRIPLDLSRPPVPHDTRSGTAPAGPRA